MRRFLSLGFLALVSVGMGQVEEARGLVASTPSRAQLRRSVELLQTGDEAAKRVLAEAWAKSGEDYEDYLAKLDRFTYVKGGRSETDLMDDAVAALGKIASRDDALGRWALRRLAQSVGSDGLPEAEMEIRAVGGNGATLFPSSCRRLLANLAKQSPKRFLPLMRDADPRTMDAAMTALWRADRKDEVRAEAALRLNDSHAPIRYLAASHLAASPLSPRYRDDLRRLLAQSDPNLMAWLSENLTWDDVRDLYPATPFEKLPAAARYVALADLGTNAEATLGQDLRALAAQDPNAEVAAMAAFQSSDPAKAIVDFWPRLRRSKRLGAYVDDIAIEALVTQKAPSSRWLPMVEASGPKDAWTALALLDPDDAETEALAERLAPLVDKLDEPSDAICGISWIVRPKYRSLAERLLRSPSKTVRWAVASVLAQSPLTAPLFIDRFLSDPLLYDVYSLLPRDLMHLYASRFVGLALGTKQWPDALSAATTVVVEHIDSCYPLLRGLASSPNRRIAEYARACLDSVGQ